MAKELRVIAPIVPAGDFEVANAKDIKAGDKRLDVALAEAAAEVAKKANKTDVNNELNKKASTEYVNAELSKKADITDVAAELVTKANKIDTETALAGKASVEGLASANGAIADLSTEQAALSARMDTFTRLEEGSTTGDAELADGRVGADGKTYTNIGGAIRGQVTDLKSDLDYSTVRTGLILSGSSAVVTPTITENKLYKDDGTSSVVSGYNTNFYSVSEGDMFDVFRTRHYGSTGYVMVALIDKDGNWKRIVVSPDTSANPIRLCINDKYDTLVLSGFECRKIVQAVDTVSAFTDYGEYESKSSANETWVYGNQVGIDGEVTSIKLRENLTGDMKFYVCEMKSNDMVVVNSVSVTFSGTNTVVLENPIKIYKDQYIGFSVPDKVMGFSFNKLHNNNECYHKSYIAEKGSLLDKTELNIDFDWIVEVKRCRSIFDVDNDIAEINDILDNQTEFTLIKGNLFNKETAVSNKYIDNSGNLVDLNNYSATDYIPVEAGKTYCCSTSLTSPGGIYDSGKQYKGKPYNGITGNYASFTAIVDGFIRLNFPSSDIDTFAVCEGTEIVVDKFDGFMIDDLFISADNVVGISNNLYKGKKMLCIGDSITDGGKWVNPLTNLLGTTTYNRGLSGTTLAVCGDSRSMCERFDLEASDSATHSAGFPTSADLILILAGVNDWGKSYSLDLPFGDVNGAVNKNNFCGAYHYLIQGLKTRYPNAKIVILNNYRVYSPYNFPNWSEISYNTANDETSGFTYRQNSSSKTLNDYRNATVEIASMYGIPVIDLQNVGFSFWNTGDRNTYSLKQNGTHDGIHPSDAGGTKIAEYIAKQLELI